MKRRDFLLAGAALGAATLLPSGPALAGRGRVRMGMIGTGARGQVLLRELLRRDDVEVVATDAAVAAKQREEILATWARVIAGEWTPAAAEEDAAEDEGEAGEAKA